MTSQEPAPIGDYDVNGRWQPGIYDHSGTWHAGFYDAAGDWQPGFHDTNGTWQAGYLAASGQWMAGYRQNGMWVSLDAVASAADDSPFAAQQPGSTEQRGAGLGLAEQSPEEPAPKKRGTAVVVTLLVLLILAVLAVGAYFIYQYLTDQDDSTSPSQDEAASDADSSAITTENGDVTNAHAWLEESTAEWVDSLEEELALSADPQCYFILDNAGFATEELVCGGARDYDTAQGEVWATAAFTIDEGEDGLMAQERSWTDTFQPLPEGTPVDADGLPAPVEDVESLEAPERLEVEPGYFDPDAEGMIDDAEDLQEQSAEVVMPLGDFTVEEFGTLPDVEVQGETRSAPEGEQLRVVRWSFEPGSREQSPDAGIVTLINAAGTQEVTRLSYGQAASGEFVVSADQDALLLVDSHGVSQEISLNSGQREPTLPAAGLYREDWDLPGETLSVDSDLVRVGSDSTNVSAELSMRQSLITTYETNTVDSPGWANPGSIWVSAHMDLEITGDQSTFEFLNGTWYHTAVDQDGAEYTTEYVSQAGGEYGWPAGDFWVAFEVPVDTESLELSADLSVTLSPWGASGSDTANLGSDSITLNYPHELSSGW